MYSNRFSLQSTGYYDEVATCRYEEEAALDRALDESDADNDKLEEQVVQEATGRDADPQ